MQGRVVAQRISSPNAVVYLHADHLGSVSAVTDGTGLLVSTQDFTPWGEIRGGGSGIQETSLNYTGQRRDSTGLLYYHARYYDPNLGRFLSADSVVPGAPDGSMNDTAVTPLTVDFHEGGFLAALITEARSIQKGGFAFQRRDVSGLFSGPANPQALNRYSYVQNNPLTYTDPTGHVRYDKKRALEVWYFLQGKDGIAALREIRDDAQWWLNTTGGVAGAAMGAVCTALMALCAAAGAAAGVAVSESIGAVILANVNKAIDTFEWMSREINFFLGLGAETIEFQFSVGRDGTAYLSAVGYDAQGRRIATKTPHNTDVPYWFIHEFQDAIGAPIDPYGHYREWARCINSNPGDVSCGSPL